MEKPIHLVQERCPCPPIQAVVHLVFDIWRLQGDGKPRQQFTQNLLGKILAPANHTEGETSRADNNPFSEQAPTTIPRRGRLEEMQAYVQMQGSGGRSRSATVGRQHMPLRVPQRTDPKLPEQRTESAQRSRAQSVVPAQRPKTGLLVPQSKQRSQSPSVMPQSAQRPRAQTIGKQSEQRSKTGLRVPQSAQRSQSPSIAPQSTQRPKTQTSGKQNEQRSKTQTIGKQNEQRSRAQSVGQQRILLERPEAAGFLKRIDELPDAAAVCAAEHLTEHLHLIVSIILTTASPVSAAVLCLPPQLLVMPPQLLLMPPQLLVLSWILSLCDIGC